MEARWGVWKAQDCGKWAVLMSCTDDMFLAVCLLLTLEHVTDNHPHS